MGEPNPGPGAVDRGGHLAFLDHLRGFAIALVFGYHCLGAAFGRAGESWPWSGYLRTVPSDPWMIATGPLTLGWAGVAVFFVVSGFCIQLSWERSRDRRWRTFFARRFWRIYPPYALAVLGFAFIYPRTVGGKAGAAVNVGSHLALLHNFSPDTFFGINPSFWSIAVEAQLYAVFPLLVWTAGRVGWPRALVVPAGVELGLDLLAVLAVLGWPDFRPGFAVAHSPFAYWFSWSVGAYLGHAFATGRGTAWGRWPLWPAVAGLAATQAFSPANPFAFTAAAVVTAQVLARLVRARAAGLPLPDRVNRHLAFAGTISYSLYLIHQPILAAIPGVIALCFGIPRAGPISFVACVLAWPAFLGLAWAYFKLVERPSMALGKRRG